LVNADLIVWYCVTVSVYLDVSKSVNLSNILSSFSLCSIMFCGFRSLCM